MRTSSDERLIEGARILCIEIEKRLPMLLSSVLDSALRLGCGEVVVRGGVDATRKDTRLTPRSKQKCIILAMPTPT